MADSRDELAKKMREAADKATQGVWSWEDNPPTVYSHPPDMPDVHGLNLFGRLSLDWNGKQNLNHVVASSPRNILALLDERDSLKLQLQTAIAQNEKLLRAVKELSSDLEVIARFVKVTPDGGFLRDRITNKILYMVLDAAEAAQKSKGEGVSK